eukprot:Seg2237.2 transcript_id=Seg2237.2/GoldUCD/mRNA.D3Y31 product="Acyl-CoA desaturase" protein_id=Seg2237.2/GoldUCD/D3Y31
MAPKIGDGDVYQVAEMKPAVKKIRKREIVLQNVVYMLLLHFGAFYGVTLVPRASVFTWLFTVLLYVMATLGITAGAHRLWSHRTYKAKWPLRLILALFNNISGQNHIYEWARDHRCHHKYSETNGDPHNATRGFFFSHVGWLLVRKHKDIKSKGAKLNLDDLHNDPIVMFQKRYYKPLAVLFNIILPSTIPLLWNESVWNAYFICFAMRYVIVLNITWTVNSIAHMWGNRPYDKHIKPAENMFITVGSMGEGFHNYHHSFPQDYRTSEFKLKLNLTTAFIDLFAWIGWAYDRKSVSQEAIRNKMMRSGEQSKSPVEKME